MRVTLEQAGIANNVNKNPPNTARQVLSGLRVNKQMMTHCITGETDNTKVQQYYTNQGPIPNGRGGGDKLFDVPKLGPNSGRSMRQNTAVFHKIYENDEAVTVPIIKMKMFIEQANTGSELPLVMFFMFLCVEVPLTFDFVDTVYRSCTKNAIGRENFIGDGMKRIVNIAHRHQRLAVRAKKRSSPCCRSNSMTFSTLTRQTASGKCSTFHVVFNRHVCTCTCGRWTTSLRALRYQ